MCVTELEFDEDVPLQEGRCTNGPLFPRQPRGLLIRGFILSLSKPSVRGWIGSLCLCAVPSALFSFNVQIWAQSARGTSESGRFPPLFSVKFALFLLSSAPRPESKRSSLSCIPLCQTCTFPTSAHTTSLNPPPSFLPQVYPRLQFITSNPRA